MNKATIIRAPSTDHGTFGKLSFGAESGFTLELPWKDNRRKKSCIPAGIYVCELVKSPRFGIVYEVKDVPDRTHILIHPANFGGDVDLGLTTNLQGCIAPCERMGLMKNKFGQMQRAGLVSRPAVTRLMAWADRKPFKLEIVQ